MQARMRRMYLFAMVAVALVVVLGGTALAQSSNSEGADSTVRRWEFTANYDGKENPLTGNSPFGDVVALARTRVDANTTRSVYKNGRKVTVTQTTVVSGDGKTRTVTTKGTSAQGTDLR